MFASQQSAKGSKMTVVKRSAPAVLNNVATPERPSSPANFMSAAVIHQPNRMFSELGKLSVCLDKGGKRELTLPILHRMLSLQLRCRRLLLLGLFPLSVCPRPQHPPLRLLRRLLPQQHQSRQRIRRHQQNRQKPQPAKRRPTATATTLCQRWTMGLGKSSK